MSLHEMGDLMDARRLQTQRTPVVLNDGTTLPLGHRWEYRQWNGGRYSVAMERDVRTAWVCADCGRAAVKRRWKWRVTWI